MQHHRTVGKWYSTLPLRKSIRGLAVAALGFVIALQGGNARAEGETAAAAQAAWKTASARAKVAGEKFLAWYNATPPLDRITWGGLAACGFLGVVVLLGRMLKLRARAVTPPDFMKRFRERLNEGKLDRGKALDLCELNPSPASRVALAAVKRWGRPVPDLERAVAMASKIEIDRLKRHVGTLRRIAVMTPLLGLLGGLVSASRALASLPQGGAWGPVVGSSLMPMTAGVAMAIVAMLLYDGLMGKVETFANALERLGAETVDAIAMSAPAVQERPRERSRERDRDREVEPEREHRRSAPHGPSHHMGHNTIRAPHQIRVEIPEAMARGLDRDDDPFDD